MTTRLRWGLAGPGAIAGEMAAALATLDDAVAVAVGSRSLDRAERFASEHGIERAHGSYEELFADDAVDIIYVATPHSSHADLTIEALRAGRHVVCEKPLGLDAGQVRAMADASRRADRFLMEAMWTWFLPPILEVQRRLADGEIGRLRSIDADFCLAIEGPDGRHHDPALGGGALLDLGIYPVALAHLVAGPPTDVRALGQLGPTGVDVNLAAVLSHDDGVVTTLRTGLEAAGTYTAHLVGTEGIIRLDAPFWCPTSFRVTTADGRSERIDAPHQGLAHEAAHAMARIRDGHLRSDVIPLSASLALAETLDEIRRQVGVRYPHETRARRAGA
ncbi:MAG: Gfo/Idh/MocA family protein [Acidimicrobiales bacterium]